MNETNTYQGEQDAQFETLKNLEATYIDLIKKTEDDTKSQAERSIYLEDALKIAKQIEESKKAA